ncbi:MAG TPA: hypothetical protein VH141_14065 [Pseudonocardia sp.]|nr:hypothetical protein [Pseudonocardia sp.]
MLAVPLSGVPPSSACTFPVVRESWPALAALPRSAVGAPVPVWPVAEVAELVWLVVAAVWTPLPSDSLPKLVCVLALTGVALTGCAVATAPAVNASGWLGALDTPTEPADAADPLAASPDPNDAAGATPGANDPPECASPPDRPPFVLFRPALLPAPIRSWEPPS